MCCRSERNLIFGGMLATVFVFVSYRMINAGHDDPIPWKAYSPERLAEAQRDNAVVLVFCYATWHIPGEIFERTVLSSDIVTATLRSPSIVGLRADVSKRHMPGVQFMRKMDSLSLPHVFVFARNGDVVFARQTCTADELAAALLRARDARVIH